MPCDVTDPEQVEAMVSSIHERFGAVDVLVNNAGIIQVGPLEAMTIEDFEEAMQHALLGPALHDAGGAAGDEAARPGAHRQHRVHRRAR